MRFYTSPSGTGNSVTERIRIDASGRVGINRAPTITNSKLEVGGADDVSLINVEASGNTGGIGIGSNGLQLFHGTSSKVTINSDGELGIGTNQMPSFMSMTQENDPTIRITRGLDGGRIQFQYASNTSGFGEIGQTYYGTGRTRIWMGANLESFSTAHAGDLLNKILLMVLGGLRGTLITITLQLIE